MYGFEIPTDERTNGQVIDTRVKTLRASHGGKHGLKDRSKSPLVKDTVMHTRRTCITYNAETLTEQNTVLFTGQCLIKEEDDIECPVTLQDAIECANLAALLEAHSMPAICMYPDSTYAKFIQAWSGKNVDERAVEIATNKYMRFRTNMLPGITHMRLSDFQEDIERQVTEQISLEDKTGLKKQIRRIYGGRLLGGGQEHLLQEVLLEYGIKTVFLTSIAGHSNRNIAIFAEPAEICSTYATQLINAHLGIAAIVGLIGQIPVPSSDFFIDKKIDMYSARRDARMHLNEPDTKIRRKLETEPEFCLLSLYLSPLTTEEQLQEIGRSKDRGEGTELMLEQIRIFRRYLDEA